MKKFEYEFSPEDIDTLLFTLTVPLLVELDGVREAQKSINDSCCLSAAEKLIDLRTDFTVNEVKMMAVSLSMVNMILKGQLDVDSELKTDCSKYIFSVNRLLPICNRAIGIEDML